MKIKKLKALLLYITPLLMGLAGCALLIAGGLFDCPLTVMECVDQGNALLVMGAFFATMSVAFSAVLILISYSHE